MPSVINEKFIITCNTIEQVYKLYNDKLVSDCHDVVCLHEAAIDLKMCDVAIDSGEVDVD